MCVSCTFFRLLCQCWCSRLPGKAHTDSLVRKGVQNVASRLGLRTVWSQIMLAYNALLCQLCCLPVKQRVHVICLAIECRYILGCCMVFKPDRHALFHAVQFQESGIFSRLLIPLFGTICSDLRQIVSYGESENIPVFSLNETVDYFLPAPYSTVVYSFYCRCTPM